MSTLATTNIKQPDSTTNNITLTSGGDTTINGNATVTGNLGNVTVLSLNSGYLAGLRNLLINGNPMINQRGYVSGTATTGANEYTLDRWRVVTLGEAISFSDSNNVRTVTAPAGGVEQVIEGLNISSGTYTLSWTGTATATVDGVSVSNGGQVTLTGGTNATVKFSGGTFSLAQLEPGTVATPFEHRNYGDEMTRCQRYYEKNPATEELFRSYQSYSSGSSAWSYAWKTEKRVAPTVTSTQSNFNAPTSNTHGAYWYRSGSGGPLTVSVAGPIIADAEL